MSNTKIYNNDYINKNYFRLNGVTKEDAWKYIKINALLIAGIPYPNQEQCEFVMECDDYENSNLLSIEHLPVELIEKIYDIDISVAKKLQNVPDEIVNKCMLKNDSNTLFTLDISKCIKILNENPREINNHNYPIEVIEELCDIHPEYIKYLYAKNVTTSLFDKWLKEYDGWFSFRELNAKLINKKNLLKALKIKGSKVILDNLPTTLFDSEISKLALDVDIKNIINVPFRYITIEHYKKLFYGDKNLTDEILTTLYLTNEICNELVLDNNISSKYWKYFKCADDEVFFNRIKGTTDANIFNDLPKKTLKNLLSSGKLAFLLAEDIGRCTKDIEQMPQDINFKSKLLFNTSLEFQKSILDKCEFDLVKFKGIKKEIIKDLLDDNNIKCIPNLKVGVDDELINYALSVNPNIIAKIENPTEKMKQIAIEYNPHNIYNINDDITDNDIKTLFKVDKDLGYRYNHENLADRYSIEEIKQFDKGKLNKKTRKLDI